MGHLKFRVHQSGPPNLSKLKEEMCQEVLCVHPDLFHFAVEGFVTCQQCVIPYGGGHVEHLQL